MHVLLSREQARRLDQLAMSTYGIPGVVLMENAGRGMAELLLRLGVRGPVTIVAGKGNNGGDGLVIARHLDIAGVPVRMVLLARVEDLTGDASIQGQVVRKLGLPLEEEVLDSFDPHRFAQRLQEAECIVDAVFGSGLMGPVRPPFDQVIEAMNAAPGWRFAVDLPSGLDADTGEPLGACVRAEHTATVVAAKRGFLHPGAAAYLGQVHVVAMGTPRRLLEQIAGVAT
ncbi:MAG: NAD(P)H-hydrate epimerase [Gemmataceae bacterium]